MVNCYPIFYFNRSAIQNLGRSIDSISLVSPGLSDNFQQFNIRIVFIFLVEIEVHKIYNDLQPFALTQLIKKYLREGQTKSRPFWPYRIQVS